MKGKGNGSERWERKSNAPQDGRKEPCGGGVKEDVYKVVSKHVVAPQPVLGPERRVENRVILLGRPDLEPDPPQPVERAELRAGHMGIIVPEKSSEERGEICEHDRCKKDHRKGERTGFRPGGPYRA